MQEKQKASMSIQGTLLSMLVELTYIYERKMTKEALISGLPTRGDELTPELFERAAERAGFVSKEFDIPIKSLHNGLLPCILEIRDHQYCLLLKLSEKEATVYTESGVEKISLEALAHQYIGRSIFVKPTPLEENTKKEEVSPFKLKDVKWFWKAIKPSWSAYSEVLIASFFINLFGLASPLFVMNVYDRVVPNGATATLWVLALGVVIAFVFDFILRLLRMYFVDNAAQNIDSSLSSEIFEHIIGIRMKNRPRSIGQTANTVQSFETFRDFITSLTLVVLIDFPFTILFIVFIGLIGGFLFLVPLIFIPVVIVVSMLIQAPLAKVVHQNHEISGVKQQTLLESLVGITTLKTKNAQGVYQRKWEKLVASASRLNIRLKWLSGLANNLSLFSQYLSGTVVVIFGVYLISNNQLTIGALIACTILTGRCLAPVAQVVGLFTRFEQSVSSIKSIDALMKLPVERPEGKVFLSPEKLTTKIEFKDVTFSYPNSTNKAITIPNIVIEPGEHVGIIGRVGAGKTTLLRLTAGLYEPDEGKVLLGDINMQDLDPMLVRRYVGYLPQNPVLFSGTIRDNITIGDPNVSEEKIFQAIRISGLESFISEHPDGINLEVGERGENLSGGQRQAIALAQTLLHDPPILVLDEPTASMDDLSEASLMQRIDAVKESKTLLISTHKTRMLNLVSRLIIIDRGKIVADGTKEDVLRALAERKIRGSKGRGDAPTK